MDFLSFIHWNIDPEIFSIGPLSVRWYGLMFALSFILGYNIVEKMFKYEKENLKWLDSLLLYIVIGTILGARLGHVFFYGWEYYSQHPGEILMVWKGGLASHGGALGIFIALLIHSRIFTKKNVFWTIDRVVIPTALAAMFIRLGNLFNSEIYGIETSLPWGFIFERNGEPVAKHPTQLYEAAAYLLTFLVLRKCYWKTEMKSKTGMLTGIFFMMVFTARFFIEFIKEDQEAFEAGMMLNMGQWLSIPFVLLGLGLVLLAQYKYQLSNRK
ncbi:MAG: prolipoprotein diacylglyceryl transferase [Prolixibacteraceae bacterium]|nr:prolipoprotein diacylglyceryl transferase [Prolixibacteraceae bacterium]MBN2649592.1 prolipoprotein diacylglyceryl transferase [Prolixibacteraceae bacterium]